MARVVELFESDVIDELPGRRPGIKQPQKKNPAERIAMFLGLLFVKLLIISAGLVWLSFQAQKGYEWGKGKYEEWYAWGLERVTVTKYVTTVKEPDEATLREIIHSVAREVNLDPLALEVVAAKESGSGQALYRFEPGLFDRLLPKYRKELSDDEIRMLASSHGPFHVLGITARSECGLHWSKLYDARASARCAAGYLKKMWDQNSQVKDPGDRLYLMFKGYNGSGPGAEQYASDAMRILSGKLYRGVISK